MAAAPVAQMETLLTCSICLETLQDPRTLGCFHTFCKSCLEKFVKRQREMARAEAAAKGKDVNLEEFNCPVCRFSFCLKQGQEVEGMTRNHFVGNMLEVLAIQRQTKDIPCSLCEGPAVSRCTTCNEFLCSKCLITHENWLKFKDHVVLTMDELASPENQGKARGRSYCKKHEKKSLKFYCETCQELICRYCMDFNHAKENHSCLLAEDVVEKEREAIKLCCGILEENLKEGNQALQEISNVAQSLENNAKKAKEDIVQQKETILKTLTRKLEEKARLMMNEVDEKRKEILTPIEKQKSEIQAYVEKMKGSVDLSKNLLDKGNNEEILSSKKMIEENVGRMKKECPKKMKPVHDGVIQFKVKPINYAMIIDNLGEIACTGIAPDSNLWNTSTILKDEHEYIEQMEEWMNNQFQWRLCYRASSDGWQGKDFHRCCNNTGPTVTVVKVGDYIFGGYTDQNWEGRSKERLSLFNVSSSVYHDICAHLNSPIPNKDYKALAELLGYTSEEIQTLQKRENPADDVLMQWAYKNGNDVNKLVELLNRMGRFDVVKILETHGGSKASLSIFNGSSSVHRDIYARLNLPVLNKDWKTLAGHMGYSFYEIKTLEQRENPASALLKSWVTNSGNDVNKLIEILKRMERYDIVEILEMQDSVREKPRTILQEGQRTQNTTGTTNRDRAIAIPSQLDSSSYLRNISESDSASRRLQRHPTAPEASKQNNESSLPSDSLERELDVGSVVEVVDILSRHSSPKYGVIRWIGFIPSVSTKVAGLELEEKLDACSDGTFQGTRYFTCSSQRAFFVHLRNCKPDSRFGKSGNSLPSTDRRLTGTGEGKRQSTSSFLFSLRNKDNVPPFKAPVHQHSEDAIYCHPNYGPIFGAGPDLVIYDNSHTVNKSFTNFGKTYKPPAGYSYNTEQTKSLLAGSHNFSPTEIEVFY